MKRVIIYMTTSLFLLACNQGSEKTADAQVKSDKPNIDYPYKAEYSSDFRMGDANHSKIVLDFFEKWEENKLNEMRPMLADSVNVTFPDGTHFDLPADSLMKLAAMERANYSSIKFSVEGWMPVHSNDQNNDFVLMWVKETSVDTKGKVDSTRVHSYWKLSNNKISEWSEYTQQMTPPKMTNSPQNK